MDIELIGERGHLCNYFSLLAYTYSLSSVQLIMTYKYTHTHHVYVFGSFIELESFMYAARGEE